MMVDGRHLLEFIDDEIAQFLAGRLSLDSLVSRLEGVSIEAESADVSDFEDLADAWECLEAFNALALEGREGRVWARYWSWRAKRELSKFVRVANSVLDSGKQ